MSSALAAPAPGWLALRAPIQVKQVEIEPPKATPRSIGLRPAGSASSIELYGKKILFDFPINEIAWLALSPDGERIVFRRGEFFEIREIGQDGRIAQTGTPMPFLNYDAPNSRRWFLGNWYWITNFELICKIDRPSEAGDMIEEAGLYYYNNKSRTLAPVALPSGLVERNDPNLEVLQISGRDVKLRTPNGAVWIEVPAVSQ